MPRYALIKKDDIANGVGVRTTFWVQGCHFHCKNCHNKSTWDFKGGYEFTQKTIDTVIEYISADNMMRDLTILGGEPLHPANVGMCLDLVKAVRKEYPNINIWLYTGYTYETLLEREDVRELLGLLDTLVDGQFIEEQHNLSLQFKGSENQRIINLR